MARVADTSAEHVLFVTGPLRDELYEHFTRVYAGRADVVVRLDRRHGERRRRKSDHPAGSERRRRERRRRDPDWVVPPPAA